MNEFTIKKTTKTQIGSRIPQGTSGSLLYIDANGKLAQDNSNLFYDATNKRLGIRKSTLGATFDIQGAGNSLSTKAIVVDNSDTTNIMTLFDDGTATFATSMAIGNSSAEATLQVKTSDSGANVHSNGDNLMVESSGTTGLSILSPDANDSYLIFGSPTITNGAYLKYNHDADLLTIATNNPSADMVFLTGDEAEAMRILDTGRVGIGTDAPQRSLHVSDGVSGATPHTYSQIAVERDNHAAISFITPNTATQYIMFGDPEDNYTGGIEYDHSTDMMTFQTNNANAMFIDSAGKVGIGTNSPDTLLHLGGDSGGNSNYITLGKGFDSASGINWQRAGNVDSSIYSDSNENLLFETDMTGLLANTTGHFIWKSGGGTELMRLETTGDIGIGKTAPDVRLHVSDGISGATANSTSQIAAENNGNAAVSIITPNTDIGFLMFGDPEDNYVGGIEYNHSSDKMIFQVNNADKVYIDSSGQVGIGQSSPGEMLDILNTSGAAIAIDGSTNDRGRWRLKASDTGSVGLFEIADYSGAAWATNLAILSTGKVGIGTTDPSDFLTLEGAFAGGGLTVDSTTGATISIDRGATSNNIFLKFKTAGTTEWDIGNKSKINDRLDFYYSSGSDPALSLEGTGDIGINEPNPESMLHIQTSATTKEGLRVDATASQTANLISLRNSSNEEVLGVEPSGDINITGRSAGGIPNITVEALDSYTTTSYKAHSDTAWQGNYFQAFRSRGDRNTPTSVAASDTVFVFDIWAHDGTSNVRGGQMRCQIDGTPTTGNMPMKWDIRTYNPDTGSLGSGITVRKNGFVGVGWNVSDPNSYLETKGAISTPIVTKTANYTLDDEDSVVLVNGTYTMTLPTASGIDGRKYTIKNIGTGTVTVDGNGSETIDGSTTQTISIQYDAIQIVSDGTNWFIV